ncbi:MAG: hypothetical protein AAF729_04395 [Pseudomonadota bacterium]
MKAALNEASTPQLERMLDMANKGVGGDAIARLRETIKDILDGRAGAGEDFMDSPEAKALLGEMAAFGYGMIMQQMSEAMNEAQKVALTS